MTAARQLSPLTPRVLNVEDAAAYMGTNRNEVYRLTRLGDLSSIRVFEGGPQRWLRDDLDTYLDARRAAVSTTPNLTLTGVQK